MIIMPLKGIIIIQYGNSLMVFVNPLVIKHGWLENQSSMIFPAILKLYGDLPAMFVTGPSQV